MGSSGARGWRSHDATGALVRDEPPRACSLPTMEGAVRRLSADQEEGLHQNLTVLAP